MAKNKTKHKNLLKNGKLLDGEINFDVPGYTIDKKTGKLK